MADQSEQEENLEPLVIFYDSEASNGNVYYGDVIEIAATCHPGVVVGSFERLINTKQNLGSFAINESGITEDLLEGMPFIDEVMYEFLDWIDEMVVLAQKKNNTCYFPVLCAHGGYQFDFLILFANLERKGMPYSKFSDCNIHFADSFLFCQRLQQDGNKYLQDTRLSIDGLFHKFFPKHTIKGRHRAMGDVKAMVKIFTQTPLKNVLNLMSVSTTLERIKYFVSQSSSKEQQLILEEKMSSLDACSRNMCSKRLIREGLTYDLLKTVFQKCSSYMDFWQTLKNIGIDRKVAKHFTSQFSAMGLENQGSLGYTLHAAMQNGSLSNGSSQNSNGHANTDVNGNLGTDNRNSTISGSSKSSLRTSKSNETYSSKAKVVIGTTGAERATSSSRAFEERPSDYAVTSSAGDERLKAYSLLRSALKQQDDEKDASNNVLAANGRERKSCQETSTGVEFLSSENTSSSGDPSVCNGDENWDSEIENTVTRGHFVLQFNEVIPTSIVFEDVSSSSGGPSAEQHRDLKASNSKRAPMQPEANQKKRNIGNMKDSEQEKRHEHGQAKKGGESSVGFIKSRKNTKNQTTENLVRSNKMTKKEIPVTKNESKGDAVSSEDGKRGTLISSAGTEGLKQVDHNRSAGNLPKVTDGADDKTLSFPAKQIGRKVIVDQKGIKTNRRSKVSSKKTPSSVTFVTPVERASVDPSALLQGDVEMTTVYVGDFPILVPAQKQSVPCEDSLGQPTREDQELETGNRHISTDGNAISREEGITLQNVESPRNPTTEAEGMVLSKEIEGGNSVDRKLEDGRKQDMDGFEELAQYLEMTPLQNTTVPDKVPLTSTSESVSSSSYETSDTGSNLGSWHQTSPPLTEENNDQGKSSSNICPTDDNADTSGDQASLAIEQANHQPTAPTTEEHSPCDMETVETIKTDRDLENVCGDNENQAATDQGGLTVDPSSEADINPNMATQEQLNGFPECPWPSSDVVYPNPAMYPVPQQYPFQMPYPTAMPSAYGFYPSLPHMMTMIPGPQHAPYPPMPFASQGMMPFGGFPPRFPMAMPMFPPPMYPTGQEDQRPYLDMSEQETTQQTLSSSPEVLGIPDNRIQTLEQQNNKTPTGISNVSYSTSSDDHSARSSPFPLDDSSGMTTPLTTPHRSPIDDNSPGALSSSDKGGKSDLTQNKRKEYRKDARPARYHTDERSRRSNRNGPWKGSTYRDRKDLSEKGPRADLGEAAGDKTRGRDGGSKKRTKVKKEDSHSRHMQELSDQDIKLNSSSPKRPSNSPKSEQLTPRREARDVKSAHGTSKISPHNSRDVQSDHASPQASPKISRSEKLTPTRKVEEDHSSKTSRSDTRSEESGPSPKEKRNASTDPVIQQMASTISKSSQTSSSKSAHADSQKSQRSVEINKSWPKDRVESQKSSHTSKLHAPPSKTSTQVRTHPSNSTSRDRALEVGSISPKEAEKQSLPAQPLAMSDKKNEKLVSSEKEPKPQDQKDEANVTPSGSTNKEVAKHRPNESRNAETRNIKWPQSALANKKLKELPKPQRDPISRTRRVRDSHSSGSERENRAVGHRQGVISHRNEDVKGTPKSTDATAGENKFKDNKTASEKEQYKEPFSAFAKDLETKGEDRLHKNSTGHQRDSKSSNNYRDVLLGKQSTKPSSRTNETASSDSVKEGSSSAMEPRPHPQPATAVEKNQPMPESGTIKNLRGTPQPGDREKPLRKEHRQEKEPLKEQFYKESREVNTPRGSTMSREPTPSTNTRNPGRYRHCDTKNDNNFQSRNTVSKASKS